MAFDHDLAIKSLLAQRASLLGYIRAIVGNPHLAEDIFQEVALVVVKKASAITDEAHFSAWVRKAARFEALSALRKQRSDQSFDDGLLDLIDDQWAKSEQAQPTAPALTALRACMEALPSNSRRLVELRYQEQRSGEQMAEALSRPINTVYVTLSRIHKSLAECVRARLSRQEAIDAG
jgi:RNA polymerase sigma-70 factor, ECF subfamily